MYYWSRLYTEQLGPGQDYSNLSKTIGIHILNFTSILESDKYHNVFHIREKDTSVVYFKDLELHTIELKKFTSDPKEDLSALVPKLKSALDIWVAFLTRHELLKHLPHPLATSSLKKALSVLEVMNFSETEREAYEDHLKWLRIEANTLKKTAVINKEEGIKIGKEEGIKIGKEEGIEIGEQRGIEIGKEEGIEIGEKRGEKRGEKNRSIEIAKQMLAKGLDIKLIGEMTGLSKADLAQLR